MIDGAYHKVFFRTVDVNRVYYTVHLLRRLVDRAERLARERAEERRLPRSGGTAEVA